MPKSRAIGLSREKQNGETAIMQIRDILTTTIVIVAMLTSATAYGAPVTDTLEDIDVDGTAIPNRAIDGVTVSISTTLGVDMGARTYFDSTPWAFYGANGVANAP
jgi:hypothetical protein